MYSEPPKTAAASKLKAPETWLHGSQSSITSLQPAAVPSVWNAWNMLVLSIRCVWMTAFGIPVEPDVSM